MCTGILSTEDSSNTAFALLYVVIAVFITGSAAADIVNGAGPLHFTWGMVQTTPISPLKQLLGLLILWSFAPFIVLLDPDVATSDEGVLIRHTFLPWKLIPWSDVVAVRPSILAYVFPNISCVILFRRFSPFHRLIGLSYAWSPRPAVLVRHRIQGYEKLVDEINRGLLLSRSSPNP